VSPEPVAGFDPSVTKPEALLFTDDLTMPAGRVPALIATLQRLQTLAPAVCLLRVQNPFGEFFGTELQDRRRPGLTMSMCSFGKTKASTVYATSIRCQRCRHQPSGGQPSGDVATITGNRDDDWGSAGCQTWTWACR
jgi:hypothetical protein